MCKGPLLVHRTRRRKKVFASKWRDKGDNGERGHGGAINRDSRRKILCQEKDGSFVRIELTFLMCSVHTIANMDVYLERHNGALCLKATSALQPLVKFGLRCTR